MNISLSIYLREFQNIQKNMCIHAHIILFVIEVHKYQKLNYWHSFQAKK